MYRRIVYAATRSCGFADASDVLANLSDVTLSAKRIWRATIRVGEERVEERREETERFRNLALPAQRENPLAQAPAVACVQMDGGRFQLRERVPSLACDESTPAPSPASETRKPLTTPAVDLVPSPTTATPSGAPERKEEAGFWREFKAGALISMSSDVQATDPRPELPATFADPGRMREIVRGIKGFTTDSSVTTEAAPEDKPARDTSLDYPEVVAKTVVATNGDVHEFGPMLASAAFELGFHAAERKAFVADGSATNWGVHRRHFSHYTAIIDFVHVLGYVYAAAMAGRSVNEGWRCYRDWADWLWNGEVNRLLSALADRLRPLGVPEQGETGTARAYIASAWTYLNNHGDKMNYPEYRKLGLPITSSLIESTVKQINRRIKGTEKFWSEGANPMLHLVADQLSGNQETTRFWERRVERLVRTGTATVKAAPAQSAA